MTLRAENGTLALAFFFARVRSSEQRRFRKIKS